MTNAQSAGHQHRKSNEDIFTRFTSHTSALLGRAWLFVGALVFLILWALSGPLLGFTDTWQLIVNTTTTIITFLMVFIIQNTQNRDSSALQIKLDALLKKAGIDSEELLTAENESDEELEEQQKKAQQKSRRTKKK
jgi:low affinity Fe/Cu permease